MGKNENQVYRKLEQDKQSHGWRFFRHQVGKFFQGEVFSGQLKNGQFVKIIKNCRTVTIGETGESDLFVMIPKKITQEDVGKIIAQFGVVEVKTLSYKKIKNEQMQFLKAAVKNGCRGFICRETSDGYELEEIKE